MANPAIQTFGKYQILERIATGGMAEIYKARLEGIGGFQRTFAIKRILPNLSQNSEYIAMLVDEAKVAGLLSHANIVQILDLGQVDGIWYIAMEYVHGRDLGAVLRRAKKKGLCLPVPHTVFVAIELLKGLEYAHQRQVMRGGRPVALNIIHRDVSPPNILLSFQGEVKLTDFGIARASLKAMETVSGIVKGRFDYMSPEQAAGAKDLDQRSDLFSVGVVLYEMLTGHHPFRTDNEIGTIERVRTGKYVPVSQRNPEVPFTLETIVDRALQVSREDRYPSATAFKEALDKFFHDAGFIFTHATLASYVRGLFPEAVAKPGKPASPGVTTSSTPKNKLPRGSGNTEPVTGGVTTGDPAEGPTRRLDRNKLKEIRNSGRPATPPPHVPRTTATPTTGALDTDTITSSGVRKPAAPLADFLQQDEDQQETLIRKAPVGWEDELASAKGKDKSWGHDDEQETVIRKPPPELVDEQPHEVGPAAGPVTGNGTSTGSGTASGRRTTGSGQKRRRSGRAGVGWLGWVVSAVALFIGLFGGSVASIGLMLAAGFRYLPADSPLQQQPRIEVSAPAGTQILLDGDAVGKQISIEPDKVHELVVTLQGHEPWTTQVKLGMGETRVIVVSPVEVNAPPQKPKRR